MYKTGHSKSYDKPACDFCKEYIDVPDRGMIKINVEMANGLLTEHGDLRGSLTEHHGHLCSNCHQVDDVVYPSTHVITAHCNLNGLIMVEVDKTDSKSTYKMTPEECPSKILNPVEQLAESIVGYGDGY